MQWLISNEVPERLYVAILTEEKLRSGVVKELLNALPWYKKTPNMEALLAWALLPILRSGFERSFIIKQMGRLDISADAAEKLLRLLVDCGACHFGEPRLFHSALEYALPHDNGVIVYSRYSKSKLFISKVLYEALLLLDTSKTKDAYYHALEEQLGSKERAAKAFSSLAQQGLLLSCDSSEISGNGHGPLRISFEMNHDEGLLNDVEWDKRREFTEETFRSFYFQSRNLF